MLTSDDVARIARPAADDEAWKREQRRKRARPPGPDVPNGPCCGRCRRWNAPGKDDERGRCVALVIVTERVGAGPERGTVMSRAEAARGRSVPWDFLRTAAARGRSVPWDFLRTAAGFSCSTFEPGEPETETTLRRVGLVEQVRMGV